MKDALPVQPLCPICHTAVEEWLGEHIRSAHGEQALERAIINAKRAGMPDVQIGQRFGVTLKQLEQLITRTYGVNVSALGPAKRIKCWEPPQFRPETTTVWSFKQRGNWATHDGRYRGNWSPYIPRNIIIRYSGLGDSVLDYFVGSGTTAVEAKLLGRQCIAIDINPASVELTLQNLQFTPPVKLFDELPVYEPWVSVGDARDLSYIPDNTVDLICAHPPYAGIINYSPCIEGDLSQCTVDEFLEEMQKVAAESYRVLKPGRKCAILIGDTRQRKHVVPMGFRTIDVFLKTGFRLKELIIKRQHNCKTTGFWTEKSVRYNFLLLAHEYLPVFEKPVASDSDFGAKFTFKAPVADRLLPLVDTEMETTTVWVLPAAEFQQRLRDNVAGRYRAGVLVHSPADGKPISIQEYLQTVCKLVYEELSVIKPGGFVVVQTQDVRAHGYVAPLAKCLHEYLQSQERLWLKEIIVAVPNEIPNVSQGELCIVHQYLLVYEVVQ